MAHKLTPYLKEVYDKVTKLRQEHPDKSLEVILKQIGASHSSYWRACKFIVKGTTTSEIPIKKAYQRKKTPAVTENKNVVSTLIKTPNKPLIALIGTPEDVIASLSSMFR